MKKGFITTVPVSQSALSSPHDVIGSEMNRIWFFERSTRLEFLIKLEVSSVCQMLRSCETRPTLTYIVVYHIHDQPNFISLCS